MRGTLTYISLLLLNATLVRMAPATPGAGTDSSLSLIQIAGKVPSSPSDASRLSGNFCPRKSNSQLSADGDVVMAHIVVPGTTVGLTVYYCTGLPMDKELMKDTMMTARNHMNNQYRIHGDNPLLSTEDPYDVPVPPGENNEMTIGSTRIPGTQFIPTHMTYGLALNALSGLFQYLYTDGHAGAALAQVFDPTRSDRQIGLIAIRPKPDE